MDRQSFYDTLARAKPALATRDLIPCFTRYHFTGTTVVAYDNIKGVCLPCQTPFTGLIPGALLFGLLSSAPPGEIETEQTDGSIVFRIGDATIELPCEPPEDYMFTFPIVTDAQRTTQLDTAMLAAIETCLVSTMPEPASPQFTGVTVHQAPDGITLLSSDNVTITRVCLTDRGVSKRHQASYILPAEFCSLLLSLANTTRDEGPQDTPQLHFGDEFVTATLRNDHRLCTRLYEDLGTVDLGAAIDTVIDDCADCGPFEIPDGIEGALARASVIVGIAGVFILAGILPLYTQITNRSAS